MAHMATRDDLIMPLPCVGSHWYACVAGCRLCGGQAYTLIVVLPILTYSSAAPNLMAK